MEERAGVSMLAILKENKKNELLEWSGHDAEAIHTLVKPDLQGFSQLLECAPEAVKLSPALSEHMSSPPDGLQCPFDGWPFPLLEGQVIGQCLVFQQGSGFLSVCFGKCSLRALGHTTSAGDAMGQHRQWSFMLLLLHIRVFCPQLHPGDATSPAVLNESIQIFSIYLLV